MPSFSLLGYFLIVIAACGYLNHRYLKLPSFIGIVAVGFILSVGLLVSGQYDPQAVVAAQKFSASLNFPELVLHGFLGVLLFAGGFQVNFLRIKQHRVSILMLATLGVVISTFIIGTVMFYLLGWIGLEIPLAWCLLFGALISPTDPIAVMAVLKKSGIPPSLEAKIAGESLLNDGAAVVMFVLILGIATGSHEFTVGHLAHVLFQEVVGGILFGLLVGFIGLYFLKGVDDYPVEILISLAVALGGYALADALSVSEPLAAVMAGLVFGQKGNQYMSATTQEHMSTFWELADELLNLLLFGLIGFELLALAIPPKLWIPAVMAIPVVLLGRLLSVVGPFLILKGLKKSSPGAIPVLTWGGLRGAISIALALSLPAFHGKELLVAATYSVVLFSLLVQALTLDRLVKWTFRKQQPTP